MKSATVKTKVKKIRRNIFMLLSRIHSDVCKVKDKENFLVTFPLNFSQTITRNVANPKSTEDFKHEANGRKRCCQERYQKHGKKRQFFMCSTFSMKEAEKEKQRHENGNESSFLTILVSRKFSVHNSTS